MSSRPWVGCSCLPSPALITLERMRCPRNWAAPDAPCRITTMSIRIASRFLAVSTRVSPLLTDDLARDVHCVRAETLLGELERDPGAGRGLEEQIDDGLSAKAGTFLIAALAHLLERLGRVQDQRICSALNVSRPTRSLPRFGPLMLSPRPPPARPRPGHRARSRTRPPGRREWCCTVVPTMSAWIGSSRPPRSISTHEQIAWAGRSRRTRRAPLAPFGPYRARRPRSPPCGHRDWADQSRPPPASGRPSGDRPDRA